MNLGIISIRVVANMLDNRVITVVSHAQAKIFQNLVLELFSMA